MKSLISPLGGEKSFRGKAYEGGDGSKEGETLLGGWVWEEKPRGVEQKVSEAEPLRAGGKKDTT